MGDIFICHTLYHVLIALVRALADQSISFDGRDRARMVPLVSAFSEEPGA